MTALHRRIGVGVTVAALAVLTALCVFLIAVSVSSSGSAPASGPTGGATSSPAVSPPAQDTDRPQYRLEDRPRYDEMIDVVEGTNERYRAASRDGTIHELSPAAEEGSDYVQDFLYLLAGQKVALLGAPTQSPRAGELDAFIAERIKLTRQLEEKFLAGDPLGYTVNVS